MGRPCSICEHKDREAIDAILRVRDQAGVHKREPFRNVAARFGTTASALCRHKAEHLRSAAQEATRREFDSNRNAQPVPKTQTRRQTRPGRPGQRGEMTGAEVIVEVAREAELLDLRVSGMSVAKIAERCELPYRTAYDIIDRAITRRIQENADKAELQRQLDVERIDVLIAGLWKRATDSAMEKVFIPNDPNDPEQGGMNYPGQDKAVERITKLMERRAKLLGLDAPEVKDVRHSGGVGVMLGAPSELQQLFKQLDAGDEETARRLAIYAETGRLPPAGVPIVVEAVVDVAEPTPPSPLSPEPEIEVKAEPESLDLPAAAPEEPDPEGSSTPL